jgi:hypothetical protein
VQRIVDRALRALRKAVKRLLPGLIVCRLTAGAGKLSAQRQTRLSQ